MDSILVQKLRKKYIDKYERAYTYYSVINILNKLNLTKKQIQLLAFTVIRGTISSPTAKNEFIKLFGSSVDSINNMISKLYIHKLLIKHNGKIKVHPLLTMDFNSEKPVVLNITLEKFMEFKEEVINEEE